MGMKIHGPAHGATLRVLAAANEKNLQYQLVDVDLSSGANKQPSFLSLNPFGQIPAFEDGDLTLFESRAITNYIAHTYEENGTPLTYKQGKEMANQAIWMEVEAHQFYPIVSTLARELVYSFYFNKPTDEAIVEENKSKLAMILDVYEARLSKSKYLAGDLFTLADLHHLPGLQDLMGTQISKLFDERPNVCRWCKDILARPAWKKALTLQKLL